MLGCALRVSPQKPFLGYGSDFGGKILWKCADWGPGYSTGLAPRLRLPNPIDLGPIFTRNRVNTRHARF